MPNTAPSGDPNLEGGGNMPNMAPGGDPRLERTPSTTSPATSPAASESTAPSAGTSNPRARRTERPRQRRPRAEGITDWRDVPPPPPAPAEGAVLGTRAPSTPAIPKILIQTWRELQLPAQFAELAERLRRAHPSWTYLLFDDQDIEAFVRARQPRWLPLFEALTYAPIQRIDLFRYLAIEHFGGFYLDLDVLLLQPLDALTTALAPSARDGGGSAPVAIPVAIFPFERLVDPRVHSTLVEHTGFGGLVGQYAFGATPGHPFLRAILRCIRRASREPGWARVPARPDGDDDDDKTVHYTTGPALVTRAYIEGGFLDSVRLLYSTMLGPSDPSGWGAFGPYGVHLHAGTWKATKELNHTRLLARALAHAQAGRHEQAAGVLKRVALHSSGKLEPATIDEVWKEYFLRRLPLMTTDGLPHQVWKEYFLSFRRAGRPAKAHLDIAHDRLAARQLEPAMLDLADAEAAATAMGQLDLRAEVHVLRSLVIARRALEPDRNLEPDRHLEADPRNGANGGASKVPSKGAARTARTAGGGDGGGGVAGSGADADATAAAAAELQSALRLQPNAPMPRLVWAMHRLRASATHAAEAVPQLAQAIVLERQARSRGILKPTDETVSAPDEAVSAPDETVSAPLSLPFVLYVWHTSPVLRASMEGSPPIALDDH